MMRRQLINVLQAVIDRLEVSLVERPKPRPFKLTQEDLETIRAFLASPRLKEEEL